MTPATNLTETAIVSAWADDGVEPGTDDLTIGRSDVRADGRSERSSSTLQDPVHLSIDEGGHAVDDATPTRRRHLISLQVAMTGMLAVVLGVAAVIIDARLGEHPVPGHRLESLVGLVVLTVLFALSEALVIHIHAGKSAHTFSVVEAVLVVALLQSSARLTLAALSLGSLTTLVLYRRLAPLKVAFNVACFAFSSQLAFAVFQLFHVESVLWPIGWVASLAAVATYAVVGALLVTCVIALNEGKFLTGSFVTNIRLGLSASIVTSSSGVVAAILVKVAPMATPLMLVPIAGAYLSNVIYARERRRSDELNFLQRSSQSIQQKEASSQTIRSLMEQALRDLRIGFIEIEFEENGERHRLSVADDGTESGSVDDDALPSMFELVPDSATVRKRGDLGNDALGMAIAKRGLTAAVVAPIRSNGESIGVLVMGDRRANLNVVDNEDVRVSETLAGHVALVIENGKLERSIGDLRDLERRLVSELQHDALTGLLNRSAFTRRSREILSNTHGGTQDLAMVLIDLDDFKRVNDAHGHAGGDALLQAVSDRLRSALRPGDLAARLGGDEFAVLLTRIGSRDEASIAARRIANDLGKPVVRPGVEDIPSGASVGVALPTLQDDLASLMERADTAMYRAKAAGKGTVEVIDPATDEADQQTSQLVRDLERGLHRRELSAVFQSIVDLEGGNVQGFECLIRWTHPTLGVLQPAAFLDIGHDPAVMRALDEFVVSRACEAAARLRGGPNGAAEERATPVISINLSPAQLVDNRVAEVVAANRERFGGGLTNVWFEVAERALHRSVHATKIRLAELQAQGLGIVIDDLRLDSVPYGLIEEIAPVQIKLARSVLDNLQSPRAVPIVQSLVALGHQMGFTVVAKGVENQAQARAAVDAGCQYGQGYLYSQPLSFDELGRFASC